MTDQNDSPGDTEFTDADVDTAKEVLSSQDVSIEGLDDAAIVAQALELLDSAADTVSPGDSGDKVKPEKADVAALKAKIKAGDSDAILKAFEELSDGRQQDKQMMEAMGASLSNLITKTVLTPLKDDYPGVTSKKGIEAVQKKAAVLMQTGEYTVEGALEDAAHLIYGKKGRAAPKDTGQKTGLDALRSLKSQGSPSTQSLRKAPAAQSYDDWSDEIGKLVVAGRYDEAKVLRERGFTPK
jgi:hypothetical protein